MRLKRLKVFGFKSFADASTIEFIDGITAVVGPNGCGKSNIADAFRWVLGEQSAKSLRGRSMPDVIFAGTTTRKPLNYAEASLTLSEVNGQLPIDYDEVTVTRRLHRSGESEYFINGHPVRYREIQSLFMDSGIGRSAFSIFEQGKIDQVINLSPMERRSLFEEAAGILRFLQRKREALKKLEETEQNMQRLEDVQREVTRQVEVLGRQAEEARHYHIKKNELETLQTALLCARWKNLDLSLRQLHDKERTKVEGVNSSQTLLEEKQLEARQIKESLALTEHRFGIQREEIVKIQTTIEHTVESRQKNQERLEEALLSQQRREKELSELLTTRATRKQEMASCEERLEELRDRLATADELLGGRRTHYSAHEERMAVLWQQQQQAQQDQLKKVQSEGKIEGDLNQSLALLESHRVRVGHLTEERDSLHIRLEGLVDLVAQREESKENLSSRLVGVNDRLEVLAASMDEVQQRAVSKDQELLAINRQLTELEARQKVLQQLRDAGEGLGKGTKRLMQEAARTGSELFGRLKPLYEQLSPKKGAESLVATALSSYSDTLALETLADLQLALNFALKEGLQGFSLLSLDFVPSTSMVQDSLAIQCDGPASNSLLGDVIIVENLAAALDAARARPNLTICTPDGIVIDAHRVVSKADGSARSLFLREAELRAFGDQLATLEKSRDQTLQVREELTARLTTLEQEQAELKAQLRRVEVEVMEATYAWKQSLSDQEKAKVDLERIQQTLASVTSITEQLSATIAQQKGQLDLAKAGASEAEERLEAIAAEVEELKTLLRTDKQALQAEETAHERLVDEDRKLSHTLSLLAVKDHESQLQEKRYEADIKIAKEVQERLQGEEHDAGTNLDAVHTRLERLLEANKLTDQELTTGRQRFQSIEQEIETESSRLRRREKEVHEIGIAKAHQETLFQALAIELKENHQIDTEVQREHLPALEMPLDKAEQFVRSLKEEVDKISNVNLTSIEEFEAQKQRSEVLGKQLEDLVTSRQELQQIIAELDDESRRLFSTTFATIRTKFQEIFQILFRGGEADLQLTDEGDVLAAGIEIVAKPPGKQMRSIQLMSGGEKCLTALALLFALFEVKPAPFCLLDEIDAPLDDSNVDRFASMLRHFVDRCQFIVITHNKCTMAVADVLVGVSMQEKGVSKVLTFDFAKHVTEGKGVGVLT